MTNECYVYRISYSVVFVVLVFVVVLVVVIVFVAVVFVVLVFIVVVFVVWFGLGAGTILHCGAISAKNIIFIVIS